MVHLTYRPDSRGFPLHRTPRDSTAPHCPTHKSSHQGMDCSRGLGGSPPKSQCPPKDPQPRSSALPGIEPEHSVLILTKLFQISVLVMGNLSEDPGEDWAMAWTCWCRSTALQRDGHQGEEPQGGQGGLHQAQPSSTTTQSSPSHTCRSHTPQGLGPELSLSFFLLQVQVPTVGAVTSRHSAREVPKCLPPFHSCQSPVFSVFSDDLDRAASVLK